MLTSATTRPPKSLLPASMPESTIAIVGALRPVDRIASQNEFAPRTYGHCWLFEYELRWTRVSRVIVNTCCFRASSRMWRPVRLADTPLTVRNCRPRPAFADGAFAIVALTDFAIARLLAPPSP